MGDMGTAWRNVATRTAFVACAASLIAAGVFQPGFARADEGSAWRTWDGMGVFESEEALNEYTQDRLDQNAEAVLQYAPTVITLEDGTKIQRVPADARLWNTAILDAEHRGCNSCHTLQDAVENTPLSHNNIQTVGTTELNVLSCLGCHTYLRADIWGDNVPLSDAVHASHMGSDRFNGNCFSCHQQDADGNWMLWDQVKYDVLAGVSRVSDIEGTFSFDQDVVLPIDESFYQVGDVMEPNGTLYSNGNVIRPYDEEYIESCVIPVTGTIDNPMEISVASFPEEEMVTRILKQRCEIDGIGSGMISNFEVSGIDFDDLFEMVGLQEGTNTVTISTFDGLRLSYPLSFFQKEESSHGMLVLRADGEYLKAGQGFPASLMWGTYSCEPNFKYVTGIEFSIEDDDFAWFLPGPEAIHGVYNPDNPDELVNSPTTGVTNVYEGQIFELGTVDSIDFEGYADAFDDPIVAIEFSLDGGSTWTRYETPGATAERWVYWFYSIDVPEPGSYVLSVRAEAASGNVSPVASNLLFHVQ